MKIKRKKFDAAIPAVAMGDIAFLLLIFFVIVAKSQDDSHVRWKPAAAPEVETTANPVASVAIDVDNQTFLNGAVIEVADLQRRLEILLSDREPGQRPVALKVDRKARAEYFEPVIEAISLAGGEIYHILLPEGENENK